MPVLKSIKYPPIRPYDSVKPFLKEFEEHTTKLQNKFDDLDKPMQFRSQIEAIKKLDKKILKYLSFLHSMLLELAVPSYQVDTTPTKKLSDAYKKIAEFLASLDRNNYNKFFSRIASFLKEQIKIVSDLSDKIIRISLSLRRERLFPSFQQKQQRLLSFSSQQQKQQRLLSSSSSSQQQKQQQLVPPPLVRH